MQVHLAEPTMNQDFLSQCVNEKKNADVTPVTKLDEAWDIGLCVSHQDLMSGLSFRSHIHSTLDHNIHVEEIDH